MVPSQQKTRPRARTNEETKEPGNLRTIVEEDTNNDSTRGGKDKKDDKLNQIEVKESKKKGGNRTTKVTSKSKSEDKVEEKDKKRRKSKKASIRGKGRADVASDGVVVDKKDGEDM